MGEFIFCVGWWRHLAVGKGTERLKYNKRINKQRDTYWHTRTIKQSSIPSAPDRFSSKNASASAVFLFFHSQTHRQQQTTHTFPSLFPIWCLARDTSDVSGILDYRRPCCVYRKEEWKFSRKKWETVWTVWDGGSIIDFLNTIWESVRSGVSLPLLSVKTHILIFHRSPPTF